MPRFARLRVLVTFPIITLLCAFFIAFSTQHNGDAVLLEGNDYYNPDAPWFLGPTEHGFCLQVNGGVVIANTWVWFGKQEHQLMTLQGKSVQARYDTHDVWILLPNRTSIHLK